MGFWRRSIALQQFILNLSMQKRFLYLTACFFICSTSFAQTNNVSLDSAWFENYFIRQTTIRELDDPRSYDSLEIVRSIAEKQNHSPAICMYHIAKASFF